jgi:hypothetical protein
MTERTTPELGDRMRVKNDADGSDRDFAGRRGEVIGLGHFTVVLLDRRKEAVYLNDFNLERVKP